MNLSSFNPRTRQIYDTDKWIGYEVVLDVWQDVFAWGVLLVPKDLKPGERRPVVVCQHGRGSVPKDIVEGDDAYYHNFAARLADRGFIVFAPHNLYRGEDRYRLAQPQSQWRQGVALLLHHRPARSTPAMAGDTAVRGRQTNRVLRSQLWRGDGGARADGAGALQSSICSGDFNNWTRKVAATDERFSFMYTIEWEMPYFNMGNTFDYAEMTYLMIPRPFMVERGHHDRVGQDQWVAHEYAKVRWLYTQLGLADKPRSSISTAATPSTARAH